MRLSLNFLMLVILWTCSGLFLRINAGFSAWFLFVSSSMVVAYVFVFPFMSLRKAQLERDIMHGPYAQGEAIITVRLITRSLVPLLWVVLREEWEQSGVRKAHHQLVFPWFNNSFTFRYPLKDLKRGIYKIASTEVITGDIFGFVQKRKKIKGWKAEFIIYPYPLPFSMQSAGINGLLDQGNKGIQQSADPSGELRDYVAGDSLNRIHWKSFARMEQLKTKKVETPLSNKLMICLDATQTGSINQEQSSEAFEKSVQIAAGLKEHADQIRMPVGVAYNNRKTACILPTKIHKNALVHESLASVSADGTLDFSKWLLNVGRDLSSDTVILCITRSLQGSLESSIKQLKSRGKTVEVVFVYDQVVLSLSDRQRITPLQKLGCMVRTVSSQERLERAKGGVDHVHVTA